MKLNMTIDKALEFADEWSRGATLYPDAQGWRVVCMLLAAEVRMMRHGEHICAKCGLRQDTKYKIGEQHEF